MSKLDPLHFEASHSTEDSATFAIANNNGSMLSRERKSGRFVVVSVSEEQAAGSYNEMFECSFHLSEPQALQLRDWLSAHFPRLKEAKK